MVNFLGRKNLQEARYFKVVLGIIWQTCKILTVLDSDRYLPSKEERIAYLSVFKPLVNQAVLQEKEINPGAGQKEIRELWLALNILTTYLRNRLEKFKTNK